MRRLITIYSWYGVFAILSAYALVNFNYLSTTDLTYLLLNLTGSIGVALDAFWDKNSPPVVINVVWAIVAFLGIIQYFIS